MTIDVEPRKVVNSMDADPVIDDKYDGGIVVIGLPPSERDGKWTIRRVNKLSREEGGVRLECLHPSYRDFFRTESMYQAESSPWIENHGGDPNIGGPIDHGVVTISERDGHLVIKEPHWGFGDQYYAFYPPDTDLDEIKAGLPEGRFTSFA